MRRKILELYGMMSIPLGKSGLDSSKIDIISVVISWAFEPEFGKPYYNTFFTHSDIFWFRN
jgi:hypothetical protein